MDPDIPARLRAVQAQVNGWLDELLPLETTPPDELHRAMRYAIFNGGKRLRPILCVAVAETLAAPPGAARFPAAALECLHTYTLIHDDLPAMDDDDLRRGKPTAHIVFGEAVAILAGDALLTLAFELLARAQPAHLLVAELAGAAGSQGVVGGQCVDIQSEGLEPDPERLRYIHDHKTGMLIAAACRMGALCAQAGPADLAAIGAYGAALGLAFQIADDILNTTATAEQLGKPVGSDAARKKMTWVRLYGLDAARAEVQRLTASAVEAAAGLSRPAPVLAGLARHFAGRTT